MSKIKLIYLKQTITAQHSVPLLNFSAHGPHGTSLYGRWWAAFNKELQKKTKYIHTTVLAGVQRK